MSDYNDLDAQCDELDRQWARATRYVRIVLILISAMMVAWTAAKTVTANGWMILFWAALTVWNVFNLRGAYRLQVAP